MLIIVAGLMLGQYPEAIDHLRAEDVVPQVGLLLDRSCSMANGKLQTNCSWYADAYKGGNRYMHKSDQMKSALVGCQAANDGVLDRWADRINFSMYEFGSGTTRRVPFDSTPATLEAGVMQVPQKGGTHMSRALRDGGRYFDTYFTDTNTEVCRPNFLVILSDGNPNGGDSTFDWECTSPRESRWVSRNRPWEGADYMWGSHDDLMCNVSGDQRISTYTVGFGAPGSFNPTNLQKIAESGGGEYFYAADVEGLSQAFESIIASLRARSAVFFAPLAIESGSLFPGNDAYVSSFRPMASGRWRGTVKKYCVMPTILTGGLFDTSEKDCLFTSPDGKTLETNPLAKDQWTGSQALAADSGGTGELIVTALGGAGAQPVQLYTRNISSYRPGQSDYVPVTPSEWTEADAFANGCERLRLIAQLHGYEDVDCDSGSPTAVADWAMGDPVFANPVFLRYGDCTDGAGKAVAGTCYLAQPANDGMLHIFDAATGIETAALIPSELWAPNRAAHSRLEEHEAQPSARYTHRFYLDGEAQLVHVDENADFIIQSSETAYVLFTLGRGGSARYLLDVSSLSGGKLDGAKNPIYGLMPEPGTSLESMQDALNPAWVGRLRMGGSERPVVAVMASGHVPELDFDRVAEGIRVAKPPEQPGTQAEGSCDGPGGLSDQSGMGPSGFCDAYHTPGCTAGSCYDALGLPQDVASPPLSWTDGFHGTAAVQLHFSAFDLDPGDFLQIEDGLGNVVGTYREVELADGWTPWVYDRRIVFRLVTDGVDEGHEGFVVDRVRVIRDHEAAKLDPGDDEDMGPSPGFELGTDHRPEVWAIDLERWNGATAPKPFEATASDAAVRLRITSNCGSIVSPDTVCLDASSNSDLKDLICPISSEVSAYMDGNEAVALYWGDECGQIWKAWAPGDGSKWKARKLMSLNRDQQGYGPDYRKLFTRLDLVQSRCPGRDVVGIYFGTGDLQRPSDLDLLQDPGLNDGRDIVGVLWDDGNLPQGLDQRALADATNVDLVDPRAIYAGNKYGWKLTLRDGERVLRDPLVAEGVAFFKTFTPIPTTEECSSSSGIDRVYSVDNCSAEAARDVDGNGVQTKDERESWTGNTEGGSELFVYTPKETGLVVSHGDIARRQKAELNVRRRRPGLFLWREVL